jgi:hypothetical protein
MVIGHIEIEVMNIQQQGIRINADILVSHMWSTNDGNSQSFPLVVTTELLDAWGMPVDRAEEAIKQLLGELYDVSVGGLGVSTAAPVNGYWFDTHNSKANIKETVDTFINTQGHLVFLNNPADTDRISGIYGGAIICELEQAAMAIQQHKGVQLLGDLDSAFDRSRAVHDLSTPPEDEKDLGNKINLLVTIMDKFKIRKPGEANGIKSIKALENWLADIVAAQEARKMTEAFARLKDLRNQYPVHDQYDKSRQPRQAVADAEAFFEFREIDDPSAKWKKICDAFKGAVEKIVQATR